MSHQTLPSSGATAREKSASWLPLIVICLAQILVVLNPSVTNTAIGSIVADLNTPATTVQTGLVFYSLVTAALMIAAGKLGGAAGSLNALRVGVGLFGIGMLMIGLTPGPSGIIAGQAIAGVGAATLVPSLVALIVANYKGSQQATAIGLLGASMGVGGSVGLLAGGYIINAFGWRIAFFTMAAIAVLTLGLTVLLRYNPKAKQRLDFDGLGAILSALGVLSLVMGINQIGAWGVLLAKPAAPFNLLGLSPVPVMIGVGIFLLQAFFARQSARSAQGRMPLLSPLVLDTPLERSAILILILSMAIPGAIGFVIPLYTQLVQGFSALQTALVLLPFTLLLFVGAIAAAKLATKFAPRQIVFVAQLVEAIGLLILAFTFANQWDTPMLLLGLALVGGANGVLSSVLSMVLVSASSPELGGDVGALRGTSSNLGGALGPALVGAVLIAALSSSALGLLERSPNLPPEFKQSVDLSNARFMSNAQVEQAIAKVPGLDPPTQTELLNINSATRLSALQIAMLFTAGLALLGLVPSRNLPGRAVTGQVTGQEP
jgi:MFS family permease